MREIHPLYIGSAEDLMDYVNSKRFILIRRGMTKFGLTIEDCEDCIGEACAEVYPKLGDPLKPIIEGYFVTCFLRDCCDCARKKNTRRDQGEVNVEELGSNSLTPLEILLADERSAEINGVIESLQPNARTLIRLKAEGIKPGCLADIFDLAPESVYKILSHAKSRLKHLAS